MRRAAWAILVAGTLVAPVWAQTLEDGDDPDHGVARLSLLNGDVTVRRGDTGEVVAGELNAPLVALDHVLTGTGSRAEVQLDYANMIRLGPVSEIRIGDLRDNDYLIQVAEGTTTFRVMRDTQARVEISTPTVSVRPAQRGTYRVSVRPDGTTEITVRDGQAEIFTPRGSEILREGRRMVARGSASDPEFMISNAEPRDDWDRWNQDRDRDMERAFSQNSQYVSQDIYGTESLAGYGRWVYDAPYGNVWVPNVASTWAPYRVGRWSYVNYYGWSWISGDPWGWAPYHYGRWYSSPYGWAWYPGVIGPRYYWRPALVGFFGWGSPGLNVGIGFGGGWGWGNVGWVPLAPFEVYRPWYGRWGGGGRTTINNINIVNNTNITNVYRNARQFNGRNGVTSMQAGNFGRQRVTNDNFVRANNQDLTRAGQVQGAMPFQGDRDNRRFSDRNPDNAMVERANRGGERTFATAASINADRGRRGQQVNNAAADRGGSPGRGDNGVNVIRGGAVPGADGVNVIRGNGDRNANAGTVNTDRGNSWRRFDPSTATTDSRRFTQRPGSDRTTVDRGSVDRGATPVDRSNSDRSRSILEPRGSSNGGDNSVNAAPSNQGRRQSGGFPQNLFSQPRSESRSEPRSNGFSDRRATMDSGARFGGAPAQVAPQGRDRGGFSQAPQVQQAPRSVSPGGNIGGRRQSAAPAPQMQAPRSFGGNANPGIGSGGGGGRRAAGPSMGSVGGGGGGGGIRSGGGGGGGNPGGGGGGRRR